MASNGMADSLENVSVSSRLSRSNCIKKPKDGKGMHLTQVPTRSHSLRDLPSNSSEAFRRDEEEQANLPNSGGLGFDSSCESLYDDDDLEEGLQPEGCPVTKGSPEGQYAELSRLWSHNPRVISSGVLVRLTDSQKYLKEAKYEILTSEEVYNRNLHILEDLFINGVHFVDENILSRIARENVFKNVKAITESSDKLLADLNDVWEKSMELTDIFEVLLNHATHNFDSYVRYCTKKMDMEDVLKKIQQYYNRIKDEPAFGRQTLDSFFLSPMQRITRLPMLVSNVLGRMEKNDKEYELCEQSHQALLKVASKCNENVRHKELMETTIALISKIEFPRTIASIGLISKSRWLVKHDEFVLHWSTAKKTSTLKPIKKPLSVILFNDVILICRKKNDQYIVEGYCKTNLTTISKTDSILYIPSKYKIDKDGKFWLYLKFLSNHEKKPQEMILSCESAAKREEWIKSFEPPISDVLGEIIYHLWDCPLFLVIKDYSSSKIGHLSIKTAEKIHVLKKTTYGFFEGQRECDGQRGLFPKECVTEIDSDHKRARDLRKKLNRMSVAF